MDYDYYMLMNDDTKFFPGIFDEMAPHLKKMRSLSEPSVEKTVV